VKSLCETNLYGLSLGFLYLNAGLLARNQHAFEGSGDRPSRPGFSLVSVGLRANAESVVTSCLLTVFVFVSSHNFHVQHSPVVLSDTSTLCFV
jgi:hypothetical protein